jgi:two-component system, cell cycle sensor histidine kinase and response regulator CckA
MNVGAQTPNHRILVIDDNATIHADFRKILCPKSAGDKDLDLMEAELFNEKQPGADSLKFELDSAYQGQEGLEMVKKAMAENRPYAMAFVDVRMPPGWDGVETIARIWEIYPEIQIVVCTAYADYSWEELRAQVGQPDSLVVLKKPFDNVEVQQLAHALTKKWLLNLQASLQLAELETMVQRRTAELERTNAELAATQERFSKAFHASPIPSGIQTLPDLRFVDVNAGFITLTGCSREELIGHAANELFIWEKPATMDQLLERVARNEDMREETAQVRHQSGALRDVLVSLASVSLDGKPHALLLAQDITERLQLERQLRQAQKMEGIGQLASGVAHDFNNILTVIQGHAGMVKEFVDKQNPAINSTEQILKASERAATLIRQLLMFSRKQVMQFRSLDLNDCLTNCIAMTERLMGEHIQVEFTPGADLPPVHGDSTMIQQVIMNLSVNARDAMLDGGRVKITTSIMLVQRGATPLDPEARNGGFLCLTFADSGCGMDAEILGRIFEPFFTTKAVGKGTGLGLATVYGIVRQHGGWLEVESQLAKGTTFRIFLPPSAQPVEASELVENAALSTGDETILVVEDEEDLLDMVAQVLTVQGYHVITANSGRQAIDMWEKTNPSVDILVTDMVMPGGIMGGQLASELVAKNPDLKVIFTSGYSPGLAGREISLLQSRNFLPKPYSIYKLAQLIRKCLDEPVQTKAGPADHRMG